ncbi:TonB-dependent receptor [Brevundimonas bacteroides]|uniref:TonB-dependent receptor n=1 Tax=Brevundimonas bacteroides TaxID=74311 RepID=UPI000495D60E|nr:TonB-dependent receptor [Brevundimonas bacteroides]
MYRSSLLAGSALAMGIAGISVSACAQDGRDFAIAPGSLGEALTAYAAQADRQMLVPGDLVAGRTTAGLSGRMDADTALDRLLAGTGLAWSQTRPGVIVIGRDDPAEALDVGETVELEAVVVTGTLLRASGELASPVLALDRDALDRSGYATVAETLAALPQNYAGSATPVVQLAASDRQGSNATVATGVNLRGLGPASTLLLVNGRRVAGTGFRGEFGDVSALPSAAVERVDVLLDGASALYGSDAVAGVVNVILKPSIDGQESRLRLGAAEGGVEDVLVSHLFGQRWSGGAAYAALEYQSVDGLSSLDRPYTADGDLRPFGGSDRRNLFAAPGNLIAFDAATSTYRPLFAIRPGASGVAATPADFAAGVANLQSATLGQDLLPEIERYSLYGRVRQAVGERLDLSADVRVNRRDYSLTGAPAIGVFAVTRANPFFVSPTGAASHIVGYAFDRDLGNTRQSGRSESLGLTAGFDWALSDAWALDGYLAFAQEEGQSRVAGRVHSRFLNEALGTTPDDPATTYRAAVDGFFNPFGAGGANGRAVLDFIGQGFSGAQDRSTARSANLLLTGPLLNLPSGTVDLAIGLQWREETFETATVAFASTPAPVETRTPEVGRSIAAVFAEARIPLVAGGPGRPGLRRLEVSLAGRVEDYDDFGSTANPKLGVVWEPVETLTVRGSWGTSFRAPSLPQIGDAEVASVTFLPRTDGARVLALYVYGGNADLEPETAETWTLGLDWRGPAGLEIGLGAFETTFSDRNAQPATENLTGVLTDPTLAPFVRLVSPGTSPADLALVRSYVGRPDFPFAGLYPETTYGAIVDGRWVNTGEVRVRGLDLTARRTLTLGGGDLALDGSASLILDYDTRPTPAAPVRDVVDLVGYPVSLRARAGGVWSREALSLGLFWNHVSDYRDRLGARIDAWNTWDAQLRWSPATGRFQGLTAALSVTNLFDADPPFYDAPSGFGFDPGQASLVGRTVALQLIRRW